MKHLVLSLSVLATVVFFGACKKSSSSPSNSASVMFVNDCTPQTTLNLDASVNNTNVSSGTNLAYGSSSGYQYVTAGTGAVINFKLTGLNTLFATTTQSLTVNDKYSVFVGGIFTTPIVVFAADDLTAPSSGMAKIRFVNLCADGLNTDCYVGINKVDSNVAYGNCSAFVEVPATTAAVQMNDHSVAAKFASLANQQLTAGKIYTIMLTGTVSGSGSAALKLTSINNN